MKLTVDRCAADPLFVYYFVSSPESIARIIRDSEATGVPKTNVAYLRDFPISLPPLLEQRAIASILGTLDDKIELNRRMNETLEAIARALFKSWFVDFDPVRAKIERRDPGFAKPLADLFPYSLAESELGEIPKGWSTAPIGELANVVGGSTPSTKDQVFWNEGRHCWATPKDLSGLSTPVLLETERKITEAGLGQIGSGLLPAGTVLLSSRAPIGYLAVSEVAVAINQGFIAMLPAKDVSNLFLLYWAESAHEDIVSRANGSTFLEISKANFRPIPVVRPPTSVLDAFDRLVRPLFRRVVSNEYECRTLTALRDTLLPKLISGELRVKEPSK
jgi:type I restriction enzyme S subunit